MVPRISYRITASSSVFYKTMLDEFYRVAFRKKLCATIDGLQADLDDWVKNYSEEGRTRIAA